MADNPVPVEKTSAWTDAERAPIPTQEEEFHKAQREKPEPPPWIASFFPNTVITHDGWEAIVRHVGYEDGHWLCLLEPTQRLQADRVMSRSEFRRLKAQVGKKKVEAIIKERKDARTRNP